MEKDLAVKAEVKLILNLIKEIAPGRRVELRIPPYGAIQCGQGGNHRRGTPPNTVEMSGTTLIKLMAQPSLWASLCDQSQINASGSDSDLSELFMQISSKYQPKS